MMNNSDFNRIDDEGIIFLPHFPALQNLSLMGNKIKKKGVQCLSEGEFPHLEFLYLSKKVDILGFNEIGDEAILFLHRFPQLKVLGLQQTGLTGKGIQILSEGNFPHLFDLGIGKNSDI